MSLFFSGSGGDVCVLVTSTKESKVSAIREAFQGVFGRATIVGKVWLLQNPEVGVRTMRVYEKTDFFSLTDEISVFGVDSVSDKTFTFEFINI